MSTDLILSERSGVHCVATQFPVAATSQNKVGRAVLLSWSQPRQTGSLHSTLTATRFR